MKQERNLLWIRKISETEKQGKGSLSGVGEHACRRHNGKRGRTKGDGTSSGLADVLEPVDNQVVISVTVALSRWGAEVPEETAGCLKWKLEGVEQEHNELNTKMQKLE